MAVVQLEINRRAPYAGGKSFGDVGTYEQIDGTVHYAVDPLHSANDGIVDLDLAPRDSSGKVWFSSDFTLLKPERMENGNGSVLYDVVNRGRKTVMGRFNDTGKPTMPSDPLDPGNGFPYETRLLGAVWRLAGRCAARRWADWIAGAAGPGLGRQSNRRTDNVPVPGESLHSILPACGPTACASPGGRRERGGRYADRAGPSQQSCGAGR